MKPLLSLGAARVFIDGIFGSPRLAHPEGVAIHPDGTVWCGTENGQLLRVEADGSAMTEMGSTGGFLLGLAFDSAGNCFACDLRHAAIFRYEAASGKIEKFASAGIGTPNFPVVDEARGALYVSDSVEGGGGGIYRYDLATGKGGIWYDSPMDFANGMAMSNDGDGLFVVESMASRISFVGIEGNGSASLARSVVEGVYKVPDGILVLPDGDLIISCYEPSRLYRYSERRGLELLIEDERATLLAHPTNAALRGDSLITANLGRWHLTEINLGDLRPSIPGAADGR